jgi:hypothetical protein
MQRVLNGPVTMKIGGQQETLPFPEALIQVQKVTALQGDAKATKWITERLHELRLMEPEPPDHITNIEVELVESLSRSPIRTGIHNRPITWRVNARRKRRDRWRTSRSNQM